MNSLDYLKELLEPFEPRVPVEELADRLNRFFHAREAAVYDKQHPEIFDQLQPVWSRMLEVGLPKVESSEDGGLRVLDFGCGTGFEAKMLLDSDAQRRIGELVCYDLSPEMVERCRQTLGEREIPVRFISDFDELMKEHEPFDVLVTNALLHHLPDPLGTIESLDPVLKKDAVWLAGHEPSSRYYKNNSCHEVFDDYQRQHKYDRMFSPARYIGALRRMLNPDNDPAEGAARAAYEAGLVKKRLTRGAVYSLVDFHVPASPEEAHAGRGLDFVEMAKDSQEHWNLVWKTSYNFMGPVMEDDLSKRWRSRCRLLKEHFPDDGASFCTVWSRATAP
ncbi:MAG: class I SAM-dependent methyltransferase [Planctomycetota bacterium]|nr:class I SAM-dependent methyltransferase [Planctomycetota bacterium]